jgi:hypothetical protein
MEHSDIAMLGGETLLLPRQYKKNRHLKSITLYLIITYGLLFGMGMELLSL